MRDDLLSQALAALQGSDASPYTIKVGGVERRPPPILSSTPSLESNSLPEVSSDTRFVASVFAGLCMEKPETSHLDAWLSIPCKTHYPARW
ncbi:hypothetical protein FHY33_001186 [Xanthomonas arboricola]|nr:hypothetical protein [Xanthomonas campestris]